MSADTPAKKPGMEMNRGQKAFVIVAVGGGLFLWIVAGMTPIPHGTENRELPKSGHCEFFRPAPHFSRRDGSLGNMKSTSCTVARQSSVPSAFADE